MARPKAFDRDVAVSRAIPVFWKKGFAAASMDDLLSAMQIGRQSLYDSFGDKRGLYLEAIARYQQDSVAGHIRRLRSTASPLAGIEAMLLGVVAENKAVRQKGCMGIGAIAEFGNSDTALSKLRAGSGVLLHQALVERIESAKTTGEIAPSTDSECAARFIQTTMQGLQVGARAGADLASLRDVVTFIMAHFGRTGSA